MDLPNPMVWQMWATLAGITGVVALYCTERLPMELVSMGSVAAILLLFAFFPLPADYAVFGAAEILAGFANPALITIMALLVIGQGMFQTGALDGPTRFLTANADKRPRVTLMALFAVVFVISAFLNNTPVVVMFIPVVAAIAARLGRAPSVVMMPLSFICILAGMTTLIGSSTNLLVADILTQAPGDGVGAPSAVLSLEFFTQTPMGLILAGVGAAYLIILGPRLMPIRQTMEADLGGGEGRQFIAQIDVTADHPLVGKEPVAGMFQDLGQMTVRLVQRGEHAFLPPFDGLSLRAGDAIIVAATRQKLTEVISSQADLLRGMLHAEGQANLETDDAASGLALVEAVVAPGSRSIGRTVEQTSFRQQTGCIVLGVQRRSRMVRVGMNEIRLEAGDVLLVFGAPRNLKALRDQRDVLPLEWSTVDIPDVSRALPARLIFAGVVVTAATGVLAIVNAAVLGAVAMVALRCLNTRQAGRAFDLRIFLLIGSAFALGAAMQATRADDFLASLVVGAIEPFGVAALLSALFLLIALLTNILSNAATAILFTPIALSAADRFEGLAAAQRAALEAAGTDMSQAAPLPDLTVPFVLTVIFAANCSFATPIAYQTNLLVMGPGHYRFSDFVRVGGPLVLLLWAAFTLIAPRVFGL